MYWNNVRAVSVCPGVIPVQYFFSSAGLQAALVTTRSFLA